MSGIYIGVGDLAHKIKNGYIGVNGVARKITKVYLGVNNVARLVWSSAVAAMTKFASVVGGNQNYIAFTGNRHFDSFSIVEKYNPFILNDGTFIICEGCRENGTFVGSYLARLAYDSNGNISNVSYTQASSDSSINSFSKIGNYYLATCGTTIRSYPLSNYYGVKYIYASGLCKDFQDIDGTFGYGICWYTNSDYRVGLCSFTTPNVISYGISLTIKDAMFPRFIRMHDNQYIFTYGISGTGKFYITPLLINGLNDIVVGTPYVTTNNLSDVPLYKIDDNHLIIGRYSTNHVYPVYVNNNTVSVGNIIDIAQTILPIGGTNSFATITNTQTFTCDLYYYDTSSNSIILKGSVTPAVKTLGSGYNLDTKCVKAIPVEKNKCLVLYCGNSYNVCSFLLTFSE